MAFLSGMKLKELSSSHSVVKMKYKYLNKNPFGSIYFACLSMAGELSSGILAASFTYKSSPKISMLVVAMDVEFDSINTDSYFYMRKSIRKILRLLKKYIRYSHSKETEVELLLYFSRKLQQFSPSVFNSRALTNLHQRNMDFVEKKISLLHEDLQYDYQQEIEKLTNH